MTDYWVGEATRIDAEAVAANLRPSDVQEMQAAGVADPEASVVRSFEVSRKTWAGRADGKAVVLIGLHTPTLLGGYSHPWLYGTADLPKHRAAFLRKSKQFADFLVDEGGTLINWVDARNRKAILWLRWMGFCVDDTVEVLAPATGQKFYRYSYGEQK